MAKPKKTVATDVEAKNYKHLEAESPMRPEVGTQANFRKKKAPVTYKYDSSLSPEMSWDGQNHAREQGETLINRILEAGTVDEAQAAARELAALSRPFLNWAGKAERLSFDVPTLPLFVHERLSTKGIIETLKSHKIQTAQLDMFSLFADPQHPVIDQILKAYEYKDKWVNRMILGDSLVVMNSLLQYEGMGGQVQMFYCDPPYGVKFGSNFQPFVRKRDVMHNEDESMTREPEMVKAYRDTWELGLHSYLTYLRDRLMLAKDLLHPTGSVFVQISDENLHHVREVMDEVFGAENFCGVIAFSKTSSATAVLLASTTDYLLWYAKDISRVKYNQIYTDKVIGGDGGSAYTRLLLNDGSKRQLTAEEKGNLALVPTGSRIYRIDNLTSQRPAQEGDVRFYEFNGTAYTPGKGTFKTDKKGLDSLQAAGRLEATTGGLYYVRYFDDFPVYPISNLWDDTGIAGFASDKLYVVQTNTKVVQRCLLMTTDPGDLVLDMTCGGGTTAYVSEQGGRRWITCDTSRVPLALARQRLLTATFPYYQLRDEKRGPAGGFVYIRKQNKKGEEVGGIVPHVMLKSIANNEPPSEEVLVDRPEIENKITRISGPFCVEATIPTPVDWEGDGEDDSGIGVAEQHGSFIDRMLEVLRKSPILHLGGGKSVTLKNIRPPAKTLSLSAEALVDASAHDQNPSLEDLCQESLEKSSGMLPLTQKPVALVFGPESSAVSEKLVHEALKEANLKGYTHLYVIGFAIQPNARMLIESAAEIMIPATYVQATPDLMMGDLLKNMRSSQIFSVCGLPEIKVHTVKPEDKDDPIRYQVELVGLDVFDPTTLETDHRKGNDVPAWFLDTNYNGLCFHVSQAFFPRTNAWENLKKALKSTHEESVWDHLAGTMSAPFEAGENAQVAVKVIDDRGNELQVIKSLKEAN